jgi:signal transduction histidine kinase
MRHAALANSNGELDRALQPRGRRRGAMRLVFGCGAAVLAVGVLVLCGWALDVPRLKNLSPGEVSMKPNAAAAFVMCGLALLLLAPERGSGRVRAVLVTVLAAMSAAIGGVTLLEYALGANIGIDQLLFHEPAGSPGTASPGRMAVATALALVLSGGALALLARRRARASQLLSSVVLLIALSALLGYLYGTELNRPWGTTEVSADTVAVLASLGLGMLAARAHDGPVAWLLDDEPGGLMARWLMLAALIALPLLGALRVAGQEAGFYSARAGVGIMVLASLLVIAVAVGVTAVRLDALASERARALERLAGSDRRLRGALEHLTHVQENERRGLAIDLHDDALPALSAIGMQLELARGRSGEPEVRKRLDEAEAELRAARGRLRHLMLGLTPESLQREGLGGALRHRLEQMHALTGIEYELTDSVRKPLAPAAGAVLYRIALEALRNVARHAEASMVRVDLEQTDGLVQVTVADDGVGFRPTSTAPGHLGLSIMSERAELAGGGIRIDSRPGHGTAVVFWIPPDLRAAPAAD